MFRKRSARRSDAPAAAAAAQGGGRVSADATANGSSHDELVGIARTCAPALAEAMERVGAPPRLQVPSSPLAAFLVHVVVGQQLSSRAAATIRERVAAYAAAEGRAIPADLGPETVPALRDCGLSRAKVRTVQALRAAQAGGELDGGALAGLDHGERSRRLRRIHGIGQWSCDMVSIFHCRDPDIWPDADVAVRRTLAGLIDGRRTVARTSARFAPHRSTLARYLWRIADAPPS